MDTIDSGQLNFCSVDLEGRSVVTILARLAEFLKTSDVESSPPLRICIPSLGSPDWGDLRGQVIHGCPPYALTALTVLAGYTVLFALASTASSTTRECLRIYMSSPSYVNGVLGWSRLDAKTRLAFRRSDDPDSIYR